MLAVACAGMMVYSLAGASPDGTKLAPASSAAVASDKGSGTTPTTTCDTTPPTTGKGDHGSTTTTTDKGDHGSTTTTTDKGGHGSTTTTADKGGHGSTTTTGKDDSTAAGGGSDSHGSPAAGDPAGDGGKDNPSAGSDKGSGADKGSSGDTGSGDPKASAAANGGTGSAGTPAKDCETTTTTAKGGKGSTTTTGKGTKDSTTTTTAKNGKGGKGSTTTTTDHGTKGGGGSTPPPAGGTVSPATPGDGSSTPGGSVDPGTADPGASTIQIQNFPNDPDSSDPGPAADPEEAADPGPVDFPVGPGGGVGVSGEDVPVAPLAVPGAGPMPVFGDLFPVSPGTVSAKAASGSKSHTQELASAPIASDTVSDYSTPEVTESGSVSRSLAGLQSSATTESAFPARIISTPRVFPVNHRDPLAAAALVLLLGVSRELFKAWRRKVNEDYWPA